MFAFQLLDKHHLFEQMIGICYLVDGEEDVADVERDVAADLRIENDVAHCAFPHAVEIQTDEVAVSVDDRAA